VFYYVLSAALEPDVRLYAAHRADRGDCLIRRDGKGKVIVGFADPDRAALFMNLFEAEIERVFEAPSVP
jgi:hypothetical protein